MVTTLLATLVLNRQTAVAPGINSRSIVVDGSLRTYLLYVPASYNPRHSMPLMVMLHGYTGNARIQIPYTGLGRVAEKKGFLVLLPDGQGMPRGWNTGFFAITGRQDDAKFISMALDAAESELKVDKHRVYVAGHSNGGMMAHYLGSLMTKRFAAIGVVSGTVGLLSESASPRSIPEPAGRISAILIHGMKDTVVPYDYASQGIGMPCISALNSAKWWAEHNGLDPEAKVKKEPDGAESKSWARPGRREVVVLLSLPNQGHEYLRARKQGDGSYTGFDTTSALWNFFKTKRR